MLLPSSLSMTKPAAGVGKSSFVGLLVVRPLDLVFILGPDILFKVSAEFLKTQALELQVDVP